MFPLESVDVLLYFCFTIFRFSEMENDAGEFVDLYCPRKW